MSGQTRGEIHDRGFGSQIKDFSGLRWGNITPTDVDFLVEFGDRLYIIAELKYRAADIPKGQKLALQRVVDRIQASGVNAYLLLCSHDDSPPKDIDGAACCVSTYYWKKEWRTPNKETTLFHAVSLLKEKYVEEAWT
jgi:hypothetical protein